MKAHPSQPLPERHFGLLWGEDLRLNVSTVLYSPAPVLDLVIHGFDRPGSVGV